MYSNSFFLQLQVGCIEAGGIAEWVGWIEGDGMTECADWTEGMSEWVARIEGGGHGRMGRLD